MYDPPTDPDLPLPLKFFDIFRETRTHIEAHRYTMPTNEIIDIWCRAPGIAQPDALPEPWNGSTTFYLLGENPGIGYTRVYGRPTKNRKSDKPPYIWPEVWQAMNRARQRKAMAQRLPSRKFHDAARHNRKR